MLTITSTLPNPISTTTVDRLMAEARAEGAREGAVDREICLDHGLDLDRELAEECLGESATFAEVSDVELRVAYREGYLSGW